MYFLFIFFGFSVSVPYSLPSPLSSPLVDWNSFLKFLQIIMSLCFCSCSVPKPSIPAFRPNLQWPISTYIRPFQLEFTPRKLNIYSPCKHNNNNNNVRAIQDGVGILSPDDSFSVRDPPVIDTPEFQETASEDVPRVDDGAADTLAEEYIQTLPRRKVEKKKLVEEDDPDNRFKIRNGREVIFFPK